MVRGKDSQAKNSQGSKEADACYQIGNVFHHASRLASAAPAFSGASTVCRVFSADFQYNVVYCPSRLMRPMIKTHKLVATLSLAFFLSPYIANASASKSMNDPYLWLEDVLGEKALNWAREKNKISKAELEAKPMFKETKERILKILDSKEKIPYITKYGEHYYNFWKDETHKHGLWRRTSLEEYKKDSPQWETVVDLDKLSADEKENWVWEGESVLEPDYDRALLHLSPGGSDASVVREFDLKSKSFVKDGFALPKAKSSISWIDRNNVYVGTDFGAGSMTDSGYPRLAKIWKRGTSLDKAETVYEAKKDDMNVNAWRSIDGETRREFLSRRISFYKSEYSIKRDGKWVLIDKPESAEAFVTHDLLFLELRDDYTVGGKTYKSGSLIAIDLEEFLRGSRDFQQFFEPDERRTLSGYSKTKNCFYLTELDNLKTHIFKFTKNGGSWQKEEFTEPSLGRTAVWAVDGNHSDDYFYETSDPTHPSTLFLNRTEKLKSSPAFFDASDLEVQQLEVKSKDGVMIPYFQINKKGIKLDGKNPTLMDGYGGFEITNIPSYNARAGVAWLERGGVHVVACIRGGGEFGPKWHKAAIKEKKQTSYDDFIAIAEDLIARGVTSRKHLGIRGGSNGGLLMGVMYTQRPDLFGAICCGVPLLDMRRYNKLLAGASWMEEYGDPDKPGEWEYISKYSPYQNLSKGKDYPSIFIDTSTKDDRVHPGHARKFTARIEELGYPVLYYENIDGGHGAASNNDEVAYLGAMQYSFLWDRLK